MIHHVYFDDFRNTFEDSSYKDNFSLEGLGALFNHLEEVEEADEPMEFDHVVLACEFSEYDSAWDAMEQYQPEDMPVEGEDGDDLVEIEEKNQKAALEWLEERTTVIPVEGGKVIIQNF